LLPDLVARYRNRQGNQFYNDKQYSNAVQNYQQAVALKPAYVIAHFNLAQAYDRFHDYAKAISEYERSIDFDPMNYAAYNNVARLYVLHAKDYNGALRRLDYLQKNLAKVPTGIHYYVFKNKGWANLELRNYRQAEDDLLWALELRAKEKRDGAAARYLLGRVYEEQDRKDDARQQWDKFIRIIQNNSETDDEVEADWSVHAQEQLWKGGAK
jgi:tetratricopeptide (TPR) repeat protein